MGAVNDGIVDDIFRITQRICKVTKALDVLWHS